MTSDKHPDAKTPVNDDIVDRRGDSDLLGDRTSVPGNEGEILEKPLSEQFAEIIEDAKTLAEIEIAYYRAKVEGNVGATKKILAYFGFGLALITAGLTALIFGLLLTLAPYIGAGPATLIVAGSSLLVGGAFIANSIRRAKGLPIDSEKL